MALSAPEVALKDGSSNQMPGSSALQALADTVPSTSGISMVSPVRLSVIVMLSITVPPLLSDRAGLLRWIGSATALVPGFSSMSETLMCHRRYRAGGWIVAVGRIERTAKVTNHGRSAGCSGRIRSERSAHLRRCRHSGQSGVLSWRRRGMRSLLPARTSRAAASSDRVSAGSMTRSTEPRSAAM